MNPVLSSTLVTARKRHLCDACKIWHRANMHIRDCQTDEQRLIVEAAEADGWCILPGQQYRKITGIQDGQIVTYHARPGMDALCWQLDLFDE